MPLRTFIDRTGQKKGRLTVVRRTSPPATATNQKATYWLMQCECGSEPFAVRGDKFSRAAFISCGCDLADRTGDRSRTHGMTITPEYRAWQSMRSRCDNPKDPYFHNYGARGIRVLYASFEDFFRDLGPRPSSAHTVDRVDNDGPYQQGNCRWATRIDQMNNTRANRRLTVNGVTRTVAEWARELGVSDKRIRGRLELGWSDEEAILGRATQTG